MSRIKSISKGFGGYSLYVEEHLTKQECLLSVLYFVAYCAGIYFVGRFEEINIAGVVLLRPYALLSCSIVFFFLICLWNRKKLHILGLTTEHARSAVGFLGAVLAVAFLFQIKNILANKVTVTDFICNAVFYLVLFFFTEEFVFRGYLWPRLVRIAGFHAGTILCGILYGFLMLTNPGNYENEALTPLIVFNMLFAGIVVQYAFSWLRIKFHNIYVSTILHAGIFFFMLV